MMEATIKNPHLYHKHAEKKSYIRLLLRGPSGSGKTYKAVHLPNPVLFNFDSNLRFLSKVSQEVRNNLQIVEPRVSLKTGNKVPDVNIWNNFINQLDEVLADDWPQTVIIDSLTTLANRIMNEVLGSDNATAKEGLDDIGALGRYVNYLGDEVLKASDLDKNIVFTAHERFEELKEYGKVTGTRIALHLKGQSRDTFPAYFTDYWRTFVKTPVVGDAEYWVRTIPTQQFEAKSSSLNFPNEFKWDDHKEIIIKEFN